MDGIAKIELGENGMQAILVVVNEYKLMKLRKKQQKVFSYHA